MIAYDIICIVQEKHLAPMPIAFYTAAVSPPHLYALAVMQLYMNKSVEERELAPFDEVMKKLSGWRALPKETVMMVQYYSKLIAICSFPYGMHAYHKALCLHHCYSYNADYFTMLPFVGI